MSFGVRAALVAVSVMLFVDGLGIAFRGPGQAQFGTKIWLLLQTCAFLSGFALVVALALGTITKAIQNSLRGVWAAIDASGNFEARDLAMAFWPAMSLWSCVLYTVILAAPKRFRNVELSALLIVLGMVLLIPVLASLAALVARWAYRARQKSRAVFATSCILPTLLVVGGTWGAMFWDNRSGFAQLDAWLIVSVVAALFAYVVAARFWGERPLLSGRRGLKLAGLSVALLGSSYGMFLPWSIVSDVAQSRGASRFFVDAVRAATDFDRDGYSSLLMGGDCAPFDRSVNPGALEIPRDNIDNNCFGGDLKESPKSEPPRWLSKPAEVPNKLNVLLISVDTVRADRLSFMGYGKPTTPNLEAYAGRSYVFENFFATTPWTRLSVASIFSSRPPTRVRWERKGKAHAVLAPGNPWVPSLFQKEGYDTIAVLNSFAAFTSRERIGYGQGFGIYDTSTPIQYRGGTLRGFPGREQIKVARRHLEKSQDKPFFMWVHLMEPHYTYERSDRAPDFGADRQGLYASEIWEADALIGSLLGDLERLGLQDKTLVMVVGDHGEEFREHGSDWHGSNLYQTQMHTVGLIHVPGLPGGRIREAVSHEDIGPTLLNLVGLQSGFSSLAGRNLTGLLSRGERLPRTHFFLERDAFHGKDYQAALVDFPYKLIYTEDGRRFEFFDLNRDPHETTPLPLRGEPYLTLERLVRTHLEGTPL